MQHEEYNQFYYSPTLTTSQDEESINDVHGAGSNIHITALEETNTPPVMYEWEIDAENDANVKSKYTDDNNNNNKLSPRSVNVASPYVGFDGYDTGIENTYGGDDYNNDRDGCVHMNIERNRDIRSSLEFIRDSATADEEWKLEIEKTRSHHNIEIEKQTTESQRVSVKNKILDINLRKVVPLTNDSQQDNRATTASSNNNYQQHKMKQRAQNTDLISKRSPSSAGIGGGPSRIISLEDEVRSLKNQVLHQSKGLTKMTQEAEKSSKTIAALNIRVDREVAENKNIQQKLKMAQAQTESYKKQLDTLKKSGAAGVSDKDEIERLRKKVADLMKQLSESRGGLYSDNKSPRQDTESSDGTQTNTNANNANTNESQNSYDTSAATRE